MSAQENAINKLLAAKNQEARLQPQQQPWQPQYTPNYGASSIQSPIITMAASSSGVLQFNGDALLTTAASNTK